MDFGGWALGFGSGVSVSVFGGLSWRCWGFGHVELQGLRFRVPKP